MPAEDVPFDPDAVIASLLAERTIDIVTTGRRSGRSRVTEIWTTLIAGEVFIVGTPNAGREGVERTPRDWLANLLAEPQFVLRVKRGYEADLDAQAMPVTEPAERRRILVAPATAYYRDAVSLETAVRYSPIVRVSFTGAASGLNDRLAVAAADRS